MTVTERFLQYIAFSTASDENTGTHPSTPGQWDLARFLSEQMKELGLSDVYVSPECYVYGRLPAGAGMEHLPTLGLISHMDTSEAASGENVKPRLHPNYSGEDVLLPGSGKMLSPSQFPSLKLCVGETLITTDGTTLLGADDKAGIAEILTALERIQTEGLPHPAISVAFTPDEEIGEGALHFDLERFNADFAFTVDGGDCCEVECETFNAASAVVTAAGFNVHPGTAKNIMINAQNLAMEFHAMLPVQERPEHTEGREGFYHLCSMQGTVGIAHLGYIVRDHDRDRFEERKEFMRSAAHFLNEKYGGEYLQVELKDSYYNMLEIIEQHPHLMKNACKAVEAAGMTPSVLPVRGGTDGAMLSFKGLPCPNLGTGGFNFHGESEFTTVERLERSTEVLLRLIELYAKPIE